ncbi:chemotaxis protein [Lachnospiraceae bacterium MD308]|nr:chemotaxis protein [Lachnospiraceae bacterium MD308]
MGGNSQTKSTERWQKKAGYKVKSFKLKESLIIEFEKACKNAGVSQASQISKMMIEFIEKNQ